MKMMLTIEAEGDLDSVEFAEFIILARSVAVLASDLNVPEDLVGFDFVKGIRDVVWKSDHPVVLLNNAFHAPLSSEDFEIVKISRQSPLSIVVEGSLALIVLATIFSGGNLKFEALGFKMHVKLPSLGRGIKSMRDALGMGKTVQPSFSVGIPTVKLSKSEFEALMKPVNGQGGFQNLLRRLQLGVNKSTKVLDLSEKDFEQILSYKKNPSAGGFQARFNQIFNKHLN